VLLFETSRQYLVFWSISGQKRLGRKHKLRDIVDTMTHWLTEEFAVSRTVQLLAIKLLKQLIRYSTASLKSVFVIDINWKKYDIHDGQGLHGLKFLTAGYQGFFLTTVPVRRYFNSMPKLKKNKTLFRTAWHFWTNVGCSQRDSTVIFVDLSLWELTQESAYVKTLRFYSVQARKFRLLQSQNNTWNRLTFRFNYSTV